MKMVPLLRRSVSRLGLQRRCVRFSSSSSSEPELLSGLPLLASTLWRCATKYRALETWEDKELFASTLSLWERHRLFMLLHTPARFDFEAEDFLAGAKIAVEQLLVTTKSREFVEYVQKTEESSGCEVVDQVRAFSAPRWFKHSVDATKHSLDHKLIVEAEHVEVESVQLNECVYGQVTAAEFQQELLGKRPVINEITDNATLERLFVSVKATVNERLRRERIGEEVEVVDQKNVYFAVLASDVTTPDAVDWVFIANVLASTTRSNVVSRTLLPTEKTTS